MVFLVSLTTATICYIRTTHEPIQVQRQFDTDPHFWVSASYEYKDCYLENHIMF